MKLTKLTRKLALLPVGKKRARLKRYINTIVLIRMKKWNGKEWVDK